MEVVPILISVLSLGVAALSFNNSYRQRKQNEALAEETDRTSIRPVLYFTFERLVPNDDGTTFGYYSIVNVGNGPAIHLKIYSGSWNPSTDVVDWNLCIKYYSLAPGEKLVINWAPSPGALGASYTDFKEHEYHSVAIHDNTKIFKGKGLEVWNTLEQQDIRSRILPTESYFIPIRLQPVYMTPQVEELNRKLHNSK